MNILDTIIEHKKNEVDFSRSHISIEALKHMPLFKRKTLSLKKFLTDETRTGIIAEYKRKSPSKGMINNWSDLLEVTGAYAKHASGISILTDKEFFGGSLSDLESARINEVPILRKDFMIDEYQVVEAKAYGADVILLIAACLSRERVQQLSSVARSCELEVLLEVHNEKELDLYCEGVDMIGVNNRDLSSFEVNIQTSYDLIKSIPASVIAVAESGISDVESIVSLREAGFRGFLIGENFMKQEDPAIAFAGFVQQLKAKK